MYISPNTTVKLLKDVPLSIDYNDTLYFSSESTQRSHFNTQYYYRQYNSLTYQRVGKNSLRVRELADVVYSYNYMMFQNTAYGEKWFYAFITSVEYINDNTTQINYEIDVMQTWLFDIELLDSFVEREHSATDVKGDNIIDEDLSFGEYCYDEPVKSGLFNKYGYVMVAPITFVGSAIQPSYYIESVTGTLSGIRRYYYSDANSLGADLATINMDGNLSDSILSIYCVPDKFANPEQESNFNRQALPAECVPKHMPVVGNFTKPTTLGGYTPVNKKLLTYPYSKCIIETYEGESREYAYEFFDDAYRFSFNVYPNLNTNCSFMCVPNNYKGIEHNFIECVTLSNFPLIAYGTDSYRAWVAQNKGNIGLTLLSSTASASLLTSKVVGGVAGATAIGAPSILTGGLGVGGALASLSAISPVGALAVGTALYPAIKSAVSAGTAKKTMGAKPHGSTDGSLEIGAGIKDFTMIQAYINPQDAERIDKYFTMYGYAVNTVKVPNRNVRPHWTYTKTIDCKLRGTAPASVLDEVSKIYNKGITFWLHSSEVGDYSLDNRPT